MHGGDRLEVLGILSAQKFCKFVVALKSLAQNQKIMAVDLTECRAVVYDNSRFLSCIIVPKCSYVEKHDMIFEALQIGHHLDLFYNVELEQVAAQEMAAAAEAAEFYSAATELKSSDALNLSCNMTDGKQFSDFASNYVDKLLDRQPLCSEWMLPLTTAAPGILISSLIDQDGHIIFELPARDISCNDFFYLLACRRIRSLVVSHATDLMKAPDSTDIRHTKSICGETRSRYRVVTIAQKSSTCYQVCLFSIPHGPMGSKICLAVLFSSLKEQNQNLASVVNTTESPPGESESDALSCFLGYLTNLSKLLSAGMQDVSYRIAVAAVDCLAASFPCKDSVPPSVLSSFSNLNEEGRIEPEAALPKASIASMPSYGQIACDLESSSVRTPHPHVPSQQLKPAPPPKQKSNGSVNRFRRNPMRNVDNQHVPQDALRAPHASQLSGHGPDSSQQGEEIRASGNACDVTGRRARGAIGTDTVLRDVAACLGKTSPRHDVCRKRPSPESHSPPLGDGDVSSPAWSLVEEPRCVGEPLEREQPLRLLDLRSQHLQAPDGTASPRADSDCGEAASVPVFADESARPSPCGTQGHGLQLSCPPLAQQWSYSHEDGTNKSLWSGAATENRSKRDGCEAGGSGIGREDAGGAGSWCCTSADKLRGEKQRRLAELGFVSPRKDEAGCSSSKAGGPSVGSVLEDDDSMPYSLLPLQLHDTPRRMHGSGRKHAHAPHTPRKPPLKRPFPGAKPALLTPRPLHEEASMAAPLSNSKEQAPDGRSRGPRALWSDAGHTEAERGRGAESAMPEGDGGFSSPQGVAERGEAAGAAGGRYVEHRQVGSEGRGCLDVSRPGGREARCGVSLPAGRLATPPQPHQAAAGEGQAVGHAGRRDATRQDVRDAAGGGGGGEAAEATDMCGGGGGGLTDAAKAELEADGRAQPRGGLTRGREDMRARAAPLPCRTPRVRVMQGRGAEGSEAGQDGDGEAAAGGLGGRGGSRYEGLRSPRRERGRRAGSPAPSPCEALACGMRGVHLD